MKSFLVNAATRLHPSEWSSGTAAGVVASYMIHNDILSTAAALEYVDEIQAISRKFTPLDWTVEGKVYPSQ